MDNLSQEIIHKIEARNIQPKPRWQFLLKRSVFWFFAIISVAVGGLAVSVIIATFIDYDPSARTVPLVEDILQTIPFIWVMVFGLFIALAYYGIRHTKTGYRYSLLKIFSMVILASILLGIFLNALDASQNIQDYFSSGILHYTSQKSLE